MFYPMGPVVFVLPLKTTIKLVARMIRRRRLAVCGSGVVVVAAAAVGDDDDDDGILTVRSECGAGALLARASIRVAATRSAHF